MPDIPGPDLFSAQDKLEHLLVFGVLGFLFARSLGPRREKLWQWQVAVVTLMVAVYGAVDEIHQSFVIGRDASLSDFLFDTLGGFIFALLSYRSVLFSRKRP
ncbi:MAG: VanZ family protein [Deltaproteobacteria bacterium]|nr:MAG: VanZ family protein [Deltaproteobacteria bacterium]